MRVTVAAIDDGAVMSHPVAVQLCGDVRAMREWRHREAPWQKALEGWLFCVGTSASRQVCFSQLGPHV